MNHCNLSGKSCPSPRLTEPIGIRSKVASCLMLTTLIAGCGSGLSVNHDANFGKVKTGMTKLEVTGALQSEPFLTESYNLAGFEVTRYALIDVKHSYAIVLAATPLSEPRVVATAKTPNLK